MSEGGYTTATRFQQTLIDGARPAILRFESLLDGAWPVSKVSPWLLCRFKTIESQIAGLAPPFAAQAGDRSVGRLSYS